MSNPFDAFLHQISRENGDVHLEGLFQVLNNAPPSHERDVLLLRVVDAAMKQLDNVGDWTARFNALMDKPEEEPIGKLPCPWDMPE